MLNKYLSLNRRSFIVAVLHICCWVLLVISELSFLYYFHGNLEPISHYIYFYLIHIAYFYTLIFIADRSFQHAKHQLLYLSGYVLIATIVYLAAKAVLDKLIYHASFDILLHLATLNKFLIVNLGRGTEFVIFAALYSIASYLPTYRKKALENENAYLQQQINPHLLFNTLNHIYAEVYPFSQTAAEAVHLLAEIQRYSVDALGGDGKTPLADEIAQIKNLIRLHQFRYHQPLLLETTFEGEFGDFRIIPLSLLTLTENIFKHGNLRNSAVPAFLHVRCDKDGRLLFRSRNMEKASAEIPRRTGIGLQNLRLRLDYRYPQQHNIEISEHDGVFEINLSICL